MYVLVATELLIDAYNPSSSIVNLVSRSPQPIFLMIQGSASSANSLNTAPAILSRSSKPSHPNGFL